MPYRGDSHGWASVLWQCYMRNKPMTFNNNDDKIHLRPILRGTIFACTELTPWNQNTATKRKTSYAYNVQTVVKYDSKTKDFPKSTPIIIPFRIKNCSRVIFMADGRNDRGFTTNSTSYNPAKDTACAYDFRHPGSSVNVLLLDAHVETRTCFNCMKNLTTNGQ